MNWFTKKKIFSFSHKQKSTKTRIISKSDANLKGKLATKREYNRFQSIIVEFLCELYELETGVEVIDYNQI